MPLEHPQVMMPPPALYLGGLLMGYGIDQALTLPAPTFPGDRWVILALAVIGTALVLAAVLQLRLARTTLVPHRPASQLALSQHSAGMLIMLLPIVWVIQQHVIAAEEAFHAQQFGEQWQAYRQRVRRWL